jgi:diaminopimelate epimerase
MDKMKEYKKFTKMQGLGNDFVLFDCITIPFNLNTTQLKFIADRKFGIGCDQILVIEPSIDSNSDFIYRIFNADGSAAGHCGNGARCVIAYLWNKLHKAEFRLAIQKQVISGYKNQDNTISINMGTPKFEPTTLPFIHSQNKNNLYTLNINNTQITFGICFVGNPHVMLKLNSVSELTDMEHLSTIGKLIQNSPLFPEGVNVNFYVVINQKQIKLITYERGCGFTLACGTGATATASYAIARQETKQEVNVMMPGGTLNIMWDGINEIIMTGDAVHVFDGQICI